MFDEPNGEEDELDFDADLDDDDAAPDAEPEAPTEAEAPAPVAQAEPAQASEAEAVALQVVKDAWSEIALEKYPLAEVTTIGLVGVDKAAREAFTESARESHESKIEALKQQGFVYNPGAAEEAGQEAREEILRNAWGQPVAGSGAGEPTMDEKTMAAVTENAQSGDVDATIRTLLSGGKLGQFFVRGHK